MGKGVKTKWSDMRVARRRWRGDLAKATQGKSINRRVLINTEATPKAGDAKNPGLCIFNSL